MKRISISLAAVLAILAGILVPAFGPRHVNAQDGPEIDTLFKVSLEDAELPPAPVYVRLLRITMAPGSSSPNHTHPGPELWRVESGTVTVRVQGPTILFKNEDGAKAEAAPVNKDFKLTRGDQITFLPGTPFTFINKSDEDVKILASVILPAGHQRPPGITYVEGQPAADAFEGITSDILGDGLADFVPAGTTTITIERLRLSPGEAIPAEASPVLVSVAKGSLQFTLDAGCAQITRTANPGPQNCSEVGAKVELGKGDAMYFPAGMKEAAHGDNIAEITLYRVIIVSEDETATPTNTDQIGEITITGPAAPEPTATSEPEPTAEPTEEPTVKPAGTFEVGQTVYVNETDVRLRDAPTTESNIVTGLTLGQALVVTGESVTADDIIWWPVVSPDDETFAGWVAEQFLSAEPVE